MAGFITVNRAEPATVAPSTQQLQYEQQKGILAGVTAGLGALGPTPAGGGEERAALFSSTLQKAGFDPEGFRRLELQVTGGHTLFGIPGGSGEPDRIGSVVGAIGGLSGGLLAGLTGFSPFSALGSAFGTLGGTRAPSGGSAAFDFSGLTRGINDFLAGLFPRSQTSPAAGAAPSSGAFLPLAILAVLVILFLLKKR